MPAPQRTAKSSAAAEPLGPGDKAADAGGDVFISYARADAGIARGLAELLWSEGFDVWFDDRIYAGAQWEAMLMQQITAARAVVVLWSERSARRPWVRKEADIALRRNCLAAWYPRPALKTCGPDSILDFSASSCRCRR